MLTGRQCQHSASHLLLRCHSTRPYLQRAQAHTSRNARLPKQKLQQPKRSCCLEAVSTEALNRALTEGADWEEPAEGFSSIPEALTDIAAGKFVVVLDDEGRENEGDLIIAAEHMTTEAMAFMVEHTSGVICVPLEGRYSLNLLQARLVYLCYLYRAMPCAIFTEQCHVLYAALQHLLTSISCNKQHNLQHNKNHSKQCLHPCKKLHSTHHADPCFASAGTLTGCKYL